MKPCIGEKFFLFLVVGDKKPSHVYTRDSLIRDLELNNLSTYGKKCTRKQS